MPRPSTWQSSAHLGPQLRGVRPGLLWHVGHGQSPWDFLMAECEQDPGAPHVMGLGHLLRPQCPVSHWLLLSFDSLRPCQEGGTGWQLHPCRSRGDPNPNQPAQNSRCCFLGVAAKAHKSRWEDTGTYH